MRLFSLSMLIIELIVFILLGNAIGFGWSILIYIGLFAAGIVLSGWQMRAIYDRARRREDSPGSLTVDAALSAFGAFLVALPGLVSSVLGIVFLFPPTRAFTRFLLGTALRAAIVRMGQDTFAMASRFSVPDTKAYPGWGQVIDHRSEEFGDDERGGAH